MYTSTAEAEHVALLANFLEFSRIVQMSVLELRLLHASKTAALCEN